MPDANPTRSPMREPDTLCIRRYRATDESALRDICYATGALGAPVDRWMDVNKALFTDIWQEYYFRREPESIWVAEIDGRVIAYVTGCRDTRAKTRYMRGPFVLHVVRSLLCGRYRFGPRTLRVCGQLVRDAVKVGFPRLPVKECPAHLHYNVLAEFRNGRGRYGLRLAGRFFQTLLDAGITKCYGLAVLPARNVQHRYGTIGRVFDVRETRAFQAVTPEKQFMISFAVDLPDVSRRYPQFFGELVQPASTGMPRDKDAGE